MNPQVASFHDPATSTFTHVVYDRDGGRAAVVDPVLDYDPSTARTSTVSADRVLAFLREHRLGVTALPSLQVNIRAGELPSADANGVRYLRLPLNRLGSAA